MKGTWGFFVFLFLLSACSSWRGENPQFPSLRAYEEYSHDDYVSHLVSLAFDYLNSPGVVEVALSVKGRKYLEDIYEKILSNNELIFHKKIKPHFYIIDNDIPFYFSLPHGHFFFSRQLMIEYLRNEHILVSLLSSEILKSHYNIYKKNIIVPTGYLRMERMLSLTKIPLSIKVKINKWAFYTMKRAGYDGLAYLNWLQIQNKNTLDFTLQHGRSQDISQEEFLFKNFIVSKVIHGKTRPEFQENSSPGFYQLMNELKKYLPKVKT